MYKLSAKAENDISSLLQESVRRFGVEQTEIYFQSLKQCLNTLADNPQIGINMDWLRQGYLKFPHRSHVIYYKTEQYGIFIVRILHKAIDVEPKL